jgi:putative hemolysin
MGNGKRTSHVSTWLILSLILLAVVACTQAVGEATLAPEPMPTPGIDAPAGAIRARDAVLDFLRRDANECVPPAGVRWQATPGKMPAGFGVYNFHAESCLITVSYPLSGEEPGYHVGLASGTTGFCWQAIVNERGQVVETGTAAEMAPELATVAAAYCQNQGYDHAVETQPDGSRCGICTFPDGSQCKAWLFYQGECGPDDA